jgi:DNA polymerase I
MSKRELTAEQKLAQAVAEAVAIGTTFTIRGADIQIDNAMPLPEALRAALEADKAALWHLCGGDADEAPAVAFLASLGVHYELAETVEQARDAGRRLVADLKQYSGPLGIDLETAPCSQFRRRAPVRFKKDGFPCIRQPDPDHTKAAFDPNRSYVALLQLYAGGDTAFLFRGEAADLVLRSRWLRDQRIVCHYADFELGFIRNYLPETGDAAFRHPVECSLQALGLIQGTRERSLRKGALILGLEQPKDFGASDWSAPNLTPGQLSYAAADAVVTRRLWRQLNAQLVSTERTKVYALQRGAIDSVVSMRARGIGFDPQEHARIHRQWDIELADARRAYLDLTGEPPPSTRADVQVWLLNVLDPGRLERWPRTPTTGELSTKIGALKRLVHLPEARPVLAILQTEKLVSSFGDVPKFINPVTGRLHPSFMISGAKTGRFSCYDPNLQQFPEQRCPQFRRVIAAGPGNVLVGADWNQVELRAAAWVSADPALTAIYAQGLDLHRIAAARTLGVHPDQVTDEQRRAAKPTNFGACYGIGPKSLMEDAWADYGIEKTVEQASAELEAFFELFNVFNDWRWQNLERCDAEGLIRIGAGRVVEKAWEAIERPYNVRETTSYVISGICADAMLRAITWADRRLTAAGIRGGMVACIHDELLAEIHRDDAEAAKAILEAAMLDAFTTTFPDAPTLNLVAAKIGDTWFDTH